MYFVARANVLLFLKVNTVCKKQQGSGPRFQPSLSLLKFRVLHWFPSSERLICCCNLGCSPASSEGRHQGYSSTFCSEWGIHPNPHMLQRVNTAKAEEGWLWGRSQHQLPGASPAGKAFLGDTFRNCSSFLWIRNRV